MICLYRLMSEYVCSGAGSFRTTHIEMHQDTFAYRAFRLLTFKPLIIHIIHPK